METPSFRLRYLVLISLIASFPPGASAQKTEADQKSEREAWKKYYVSCLPTYRFFIGKDKKPLKAIPEAKLRWDNPVREGRTHGELFVWTNQGRGAVVGNILSYDVGENQRRVAHEFHSFDTEEIICERKEEPFKLSAPGVEYIPIPGAPIPAKSRGLRFAQMRRMAKDFKASTKKGDVAQPLRALSAPLYRFETKKVEDDGAIFAYVTGTDPEILVAIVAKKTDDGPAWFFGAGRFTDLQIDLKYKTKVVWKFQDWSSYEGGYHARHGVDFQPHMPRVPEQAVGKDQGKAKKDEPAN